MLFDNKANSIRKKLVERQETLAVAESVTAGYVQAILSSAEEATFFFQGGITTYNLGQKCKHLNIDPIEGMKSNCVSEKIAQQMSIGVQELFQSDYGIAITGYAAPLPEKDIEEIFAYVAVSYKGRLLTVQRIGSSKQAAPAAQVDYAEQVLRIFEGCLEALP
jgi:nicotinamide-nucleotide amidase